MKKLLGIVGLGVLLSGCFATPPSSITSNKTINLNLKSRSNLVCGGNKIKISPNYLFFISTARSCQPRYKLVDFECPQNKWPPAALVPGPVDRVGGYFELVLDVSPNFVTSPKTKFFGFWVFLTEFWDLFDVFCRFLGI